MQTGAHLVLVTRHDHIKEIVPQIVPRIVVETSSKNAIFLEVSGTILVLFVVLEIVPKIVPKNFATEQASVSGEFLCRHRHAFWAKIGDILTRRRHVADMSPTFPAKFLGGFGVRGHQTRD
jgi:hypothetical protein